jgi:hypothetical protein
VIVNLYIYKVQSEFAEETETRYIVQAHRVGTPHSKWANAGSLVELHYKMRPPLPGLAWGEIENKLEKNGGVEINLELEEFAYHQLFANS